MKLRFYGWFTPAIAVLMIAGLVWAQNTTQVSLSDAQRAAYWRAQYELATSNCENEKTRGNWDAVIAATCPVGQSISTSTPGTATTKPGEPSCVPN